MFKTTIPIIKEERFDEQSGTIKTIEGTIDVYIDTSLYAEERWEINFPQNAKKETLTAYCERITNSNSWNNTSLILSHLKAFYCMIECDEFPTFKKFSQMFSFRDVDYTRRLSERLKFIFEKVINSSMASQKN